MARLFDQKSGALTAPASAAPVTYLASSVTAVSALLAADEALRSSAVILMARTESG